MLKLIEILATYREYDLENRSEYRGTVFKGGKEIDVCTHKHRSKGTALICAKKMIRKNNYEMRNMRKT